MSTSKWCRLGLARAATANSLANMIRVQELV